MSFRYCFERWLGNIIKKKKKSPFSFLDISSKTRMTNVWGREWFETIFGQVGVLFSPPLPLKM